MNLPLSACAPLSALRVLGVLLLLSPPLACDSGGGGGTADADAAGDGTGGLDVTSDATADTPADATPDTAVDTVADAGPDVTPDGSPDATPDASPDTTTDVDTGPSDPQLTVAGQQLRLLIDLVNASGGGLTQAELATKFAPELDMAAVQNRLKTLGLQTSPWSWEGTEPGFTEHDLVARVKSRDDLWRWVGLRVETASPNRIRLFTSGLNPALDPAIGPPAEGEMLLLATAGVSAATGGMVELLDPSTGEGFEPAVVGTPEGRYGSVKLSPPPPHELVGIRVTAEGSRPTTGWGPRLRPDPAFPLTGATALTEDNLVAVLAAAGLEEDATKAQILGRTAYFGAESAAEALLAEDIEVGCAQVSTDPATGIHYTRSDSLLPALDTMLTQRGFGYWWALNAEPTAYEVTVDVLGTSAKQSFPAPRAGEVTFYVGELSEAGLTANPQPPGCLTLPEGETWSFTLEDPDATTSCGTALTTFGVVDAEAMLMPFFTEHGAQSCGFDSYGRLSECVVPEHRAFLFGPAAARRQATYSGTLLSSREMVLTEEVSVTCAGADCAALSAAFGVTFPCSETLVRRGAMVLPEEVTTPVAQDCTVEAELSGSEPTHLVPLRVVNQGSAALQLFRILDLGQREPTPGELAPGTMLELFSHVGQAFVVTDTEGTCQSVYVVEGTKGSQLVLE